jgi:hypothetical protein
VLGVPGPGQVHGQIIIIIIIIIIVITITPFPSADRYALSLGFVSVILQEKRTQENECSVCQDRVKSMACVPCGHRFCTEVRRDDDDDDDDDDYNDLSSSHHHDRVRVHGLRALRTQVSQR